MTSTLDYLAKIKTTLYDIGVLLKEQIKAEETTALLLAKENPDITPFEELRFSILKASDTYYQAVSLISLNSNSLSIKIDDNSYDDIAIEYAKKVESIKEELYALKDSTIKSLLQVCEDDPDWGRRSLGLSSEDIEQIKSFVSVKNEHSILSVIRLLAKAKDKKPTNSKILQKTFHTLSLTQQNLSWTVNRVREQMFYELGFNETFSFLCDKIAKS